MDMKRSLQAAIRKFHKTFALRPLPDKVGLYFHCLEESQYAAFSECIKFWTSHGYRIVDIEDFVGLNQEKLLFLSFDDNYRSWHRALPLLDSLKAKATFFVNTKPIRGVAERSEIDGYFDIISHQGERETLSKTEICEIAEAGHTIGCHGHSHVNLGAVSEDVARTEILSSKKLLEDILQFRVADFSYPFGMRRNFKDSLRKFCLESGFRSICNATPGLLYSKQTLHSLNRSSWDLEMPLEYNIDNIRIDGRIFELITGRSAVG